MHSGCANAISQVAQKYGVIYLNTNSSSPTESGKDCHRVKFVWDGNGTNFAKAVGQERDRDLRQELAADDQRLCLGPHHVGRHQEAPGRAGRRDQSTSSWCRWARATSPRYLLKIQQSSRHVIATAIGGDDIKALRQQVGQLGIGDKPAWINNQQDWPDVYGLPLDNLFGVFGTTWYWNSTCPAWRSSCSATRQAYPDTQMRCRAMCSTMATWPRASFWKPSSAPAPPTTSP